MSFKSLGRIPKWSTARKDYTLSSTGKCELNNGYHRTQVTKANHRQARWWGCGRWEGGCLLCSRKPALSQHHGQQISPAPEGETVGVASSGNSISNPPDPASPSHYKYCIKPPYSPDMKIIGIMTQLAHILFKKINIMPCLWCEVEWKGEWFIVEQCVIRARSGTAKLKTSAKVPLWRNAFISLEQARLQLKCSAKNRLYFPLPATSRNKTK